MPNPYYIPPPPPPPTGSGQPTPTPTPTVGEQSTPTPTPTLPAVTCVGDFQIFDWQFTIWGRGWGSNAGLKKQMEGCGLVTSWNFHSSSSAQTDQGSNNVGLYVTQWAVTFELPTTIKDGCVERAIHSAGGPSGVACNDAND
jgi:hypothetical protein